MPSCPRSTAAPGAHLREGGGRLDRSSIQPRRGSTWKPWALRRAASRAWCGRRNCLLGLQSYFTSGETETRAWTISIGAKKPQAAGVIHTDFERGFIKAETASFADYSELNGEKGCRDAGKLRQEGKEYVVQDGDVMHFKFNV